MVFQDIKIEIYSPSVNVQTEEPRVVDCSDTVNCSFCLYVQIGVTP